MPKSKRNVSEKTKQRKMDVRDRKIKKLAALHPLSRKAAKEHKNLLHIDTVDKHIKSVDTKHKPEVFKSHWFQKAVWMDDQPVYTVEELRDLALEYVTRNDDEIMEAQVSALSGATVIKRIAPTSKAGQALAARIHEQEMFQKGQFEVPDLTSKKTVLQLRDWKTGNIDQMRNLKKLRIGDASDVEEGRLQLFHQ